MDNVDSKGSIFDKVKHLPNALDLAKRMHNPKLWILVGLYFTIGTIMMWMFIRPKTWQGAMATIGLATLWNVY